LSIHYCRIGSFILTVYSQFEYTMPNTLQWDGHIPSRTSTEPNNGVCDILPVTLRIHLKVFFSLPQWIPVLCTKIWPPCFQVRGRHVCNRQARAPRFQILDVGVRASDPLPLCRLDGHIWRVDICIFRWPMTSLTNGRRCDMHTNLESSAERINNCRYCFCSFINRRSTLWMCSSPEAPLDSVLQQTGPPTILRHRFQSAWIVAIYFILFRNTQLCGIYRFQIIRSIGWISRGAGASQKCIGQHVFVRTCFHYWNTKIPSLSQFMCMFQTLW
jgi:hypothetical protein